MPRISRAPSPIKIDIFGPWIALFCGTPHSRRVTINYSKRACISRTMASSIHYFVELFDWKLAHSELQWKCVSIAIYWIDTHPESTIFLLYYQVHPYASTMARDDQEWHRWRMGSGSLLGMWLCASRRRSNKWVPQSILSIIQHPSIYTLVAYIIAPPFNERTTAIPAAGESFELEAAPKYLEIADKVWNEKHMSNVNKHGILSQNYTNQGPNSNRTTRTSSN
jgi:hypothetical protein